MSTMNKAKKKGNTKAKCLVRAVIPDYIQAGK